MELRLTFNEDEVNYDKWRPTYVPELFDEIIRYSGINETKQALEIGIGTGQATLPILQTKCKLSAIEPGDRLAEFSRQKFAAYPNFEVIQGDYEQFISNSNTYDLIYSATAFHWIPKEISYSKTYDLLKSGGVLALFWNHPFVNRIDDPLHQEIRKIYNKYRPSNRPIIEFDIKDCTTIMDDLQQNGFRHSLSKLFYQTRTFTAESYVALLNSYSDHRALPKQVKDGLEKEISSAINCLGGSLKVYDTMDLYLAQKP
ncbi:class I SAM-dependent methyltransferase [Paenibacillus sp. EC2-1]|uniref:class I SAM-dependent methyltransferase n=1 Tax=Paenibacillus sp. EC2-1 TaxID=3388665 RepID=UPI003BEEC8E1